MKVLRTDEFDKWLRHLKDARARARINMRLRRIELTGNLGDCKFVRKGIIEFRIDYGPGYRVYAAKRERDLLLLLIGGSKASQESDIRRAVVLNNLYS